MGDRADLIEADEMAVANYVHVGYGDQFTAVGRPADQLGCVENWSMAPTAAALLRSGNGYRDAS